MTLATRTGASSVRLPVDGGELAVRRPLPSRYPAGRRGFARLLMKGPFDPQSGPGTLDVLARSVHLDANPDSALEKVLSSF